MKPWSMLAGAAVALALIAGSRAAPVPPASGTHSIMGDDIAADAEFTAPLGIKNFREDSHA
jgi:hypothetical protein